MRAVLIDGQKTLKLEQGIITTENSTFVQFGAKIVQMTEDGPRFLTEQNSTEALDVTPNLFEGILQRENISIAKNSSGKWINSRNTSLLLPLPIVVNPLKRSLR